MAVHLRLTRCGRHKRPFYRVVAADSRMRRDGRFLEIVGTYDPLKATDKADFKQDRIFGLAPKGRTANESGPCLASPGWDYESVGPIEKDGFCLFLSSDRRTESRSLVVPGSSEKSRNFSS